MGQIKKIILDQLFLWNNLRPKNSNAALLTSEGNFSDFKVAIII